MSIKLLYKYWINSTNIIKTMDNFSCFSKNLSYEDVQEDVWDFVPAVPNSSAARNAITAISFFVMVVGLFCNCLYLLIIVKKRLYVEKPTIVLLINLAVINIIICIFVLPFNVATGIMRGFYYGQSDAIRCHVCRLGVIYVAALFAALTNLSLLSVDRLVYIRMAIKYENIVTNKRILIAIMMAWIYSIAMSFPTQFGFGEILFSTAAGICTINTSGSSPYVRNSLYLLFLSIAILLPLLAIFLSNAWVLYIAQKYIIRKLKKTTTSSGANKYNSAQINLIKVYAVIFLVHVITWLPIILRLIVGIASEETRYTTRVQVIGIIAHLSLMSQVVTQPLLQAFLLRHVFDEIKTCFKHILPYRYLRRNQLSM